MLAMKSFVQGSGAPAGRGRLVLAGVVAAMAVVLWPLATALAQDADDNALDRIPAAAIAAPAAVAVPVIPTARGGRNASYFVEEAPEYSQNRSTLVVPVPGGSGPQWVNRLFVDGRSQWDLTDSLTAAHSERMEFFVQNEEAFPAENTLNYDLREAYLSWSPDPDRGWFLDVGRINIRSGVAYAFNPTDFFRKQSVVDETSQDPSVLRDNRLGTLMLRGQHFMDRGALTAIFAPKLYSELPVGQTIPALDPELRRTNADYRAALTASYNFGHDLNPQAIVFHEGSAWAYGLNLARGFGNQTTAYLEWSGSRRNSLVDESMAYAVETGTFGSVSPPIPSDGTRRFYQDLATGLSYTTKANVNFIVEYDFHQAGLSGADWTQWFASGAAAAPGSELVDKLWYVRAYAQAEQEPINRQTLFLRVARDDWPVPKLSLAALSIVDLEHASSLEQLEVDYGFSNRFGMELMYQGTLGKPRSDYGSSPVEHSYLFNLKLYL
jgi:hypothetical protein